MKKQVDIKIVVYKLVFVALLLLFITIVSQLFGYFSSGEDQLGRFSEVLTKQIVHQPEINWNLQTNEKSALLEIHDQNEIEKAYKSAWYFLNKSLYEQKDIALADHFSDSLRQKILRQIDQSEYIVEQVDLEHNIKFHLFSYDRQLLAFKDLAVPIYSEFKGTNNNLIAKSLDTTSYEVVLVLEDGKWKINEILQIDYQDDYTVSAKNVFPQVPMYQDGENSKQTNYIPYLKGINYYPKDNPWLAFWEKFDMDVFIKDCALIKSLGFNSVRLFVPYQHIGGYQIRDSFKEDLDKALKYLHEEDLYCILTLFDFPNGYGIEHYPAHLQYLKQIVTAAKPYPKLIWDIKNEPDLDFEYYDKRTVINWLDFMSYHLQKLDTIHPVTIGWSTDDYATLFQERLDIVSFHYYNKEKSFIKSIEKLKKQISSKRIMCTEFGMTSYVSNILPFGHTENEQAVYVQEMVKHLNNIDVDYFIWNLYDYPSLDTKVFGRKPWIINAQKEMGLIDQSGKRKKVVSALLNESHHVRLFGDVFKPYTILYLFIFLLFLLLSFLFRKSLLSRR